MLSDADIDALARSVEKAELEKLLRDRGLNIFMARARFHDADLHKEVWGEYMRRTSRPGLFSRLLGLN